MPRVISFSRISIDYRELPKMVLDMLIAAYDKHSSAEENSDMKSDNVKDMEGLKGHFLRLYKRLSGNEAGSLHELPEIRNLRLEATPYALLEDYKNYLQDILLTEGVSLAERRKSQGPLSDKDVLIYEILTRLVALALCNDNYEERDGEKLYMVLASFIASLNASSDRLQTKGWFSDRVSNFNRCFITTHVHWMRIINTTVGMVKLISSKDTLVEVMGAQLESLEVVVRKRLIFALTPGNVNPDDLWGETSANKLRDIENAILTGSRSRDQFQLLRRIPTSTSFQEDLLSIQERQNVVIEALLVSTGSVARNKNIRGFYGLLYQIKLIQFLIGHVSNLIAVTGWVALLSGVIDLQVVNAVIMKLADEATNLLSLEYRAEDLKQIDMSLLSRDGDIHFHDVLSVLIKASQKFEALRSPEIIRTLQSFVTASMDELLVIETGLKETGMLKHESKLVCVESRDARIPISAVRDQSLPDITPAGQHDNYPVESAKLSFPLVVIGSLQVPDLEEIKTAVQRVQADNIKYQLAKVFTPRFLLKGFKTSYDYFRRPGLTELYQMIQEAHQSIDAFSISSEARGGQKSKDDLQRLSEKIRSLYTKLNQEMMHAAKKRKRLSDAGFINQISACRMLDKWVDALYAQVVNLQSRLEGLGIPLKCTEVLEEAVKKSNPFAYAVAIGFFPGKSGNGSMATGNAFENTESSRGEDANISLEHELNQVPDIKARLARLELSSTS